MNSLDGLVGIDQNLLLRANALCGVLRNKVASEKQIDEIPTIIFIDDNDTRQSLRDHKIERGGDFPVVRVGKDEGFGVSLRKLKIHPTSIIERAKHMTRQHKDVPVNSIDGILLVAACQLTLQSLYATSFGVMPPDEEIVNLVNFVAENY
jgi:hypothetical protein